MRTVTITQLKSDFSEILEASAKAPVVVTRNGKPVAVIVGVRGRDDVERLQMAYSPQLRYVLDKSLNEIQKLGGIPHEQFWAELRSRRAVKRPKKRPRAAKLRLS